MALFSCPWYSNTGKGFCKYFQFTQYSLQCSLCAMHSFRELEVILNLLLLIPLGKTRVSDMFMNYLCACAANHFIEHNMFFYMLLPVILIILNRSYEFRSEYK